MIGFISYERTCLHTGDMSKVKGKDRFLKEKNNLLYTKEFPQDYQILQAKRG